jgi:hypothetical protein
MALPTKSAGQILTAAEYNAIIGAVNACPPSLEVTVTTLDGNGSLVLPTGEETDLNLEAAGGGTFDVNGCSAPVRSPWPLYIVVISNDTVTLKHEDLTEPTPAKRFRLPGNTDLVLTQGKGVTLRYKSVPVGARWVAVVAA